MFRLRRNQVPDLHKQKLKTIPEWNLICKDEIFAKFLKTPFFIEHLWWLFTISLYIYYLLYQYIWSAFVAKSERLFFRYVKQIDKRFIK